MKILLDESVPRPLLQNLPEHECATVQDCGWAGMSNGELLRRAKPDFDLFITCDQNIRYQQNLARQEISILQVSTNDLHRLLASISVIRSTVGSIQKAE